MKKSLLFSVLFLGLFPLVSLAAFDRDLYFGLRDNADITKLQEFLRDQGVYSGPITGNFFSLTLEGVRAFQKREGIEPMAGYFGAKTRRRANVLATPRASAVPTSAEEILAKIASLQEVIRKLQEEVAVSPASSSPTVVEPVEKPVPVSTNTLIVSSTSAGTFPENELSFFKMGEVTLHNDTSSEVLLSRFEVLLSDELDSTPNRNQKVSFLWRAGLLSTDDLISKTDFTFLLTPPKVGEPHKAVVNLPFAVRLVAGEKKTVSLWIEQLRFVKSGTLKITSTSIVATSAITVKGSFDIVLTKAPAL